MITPARSVENDSSPHRPRAERRPVSELVAYHSTGDNEMLDRIGNISSSGVYLLTNERWPAGAPVPITLQKLGPPEKRPERRITLQAVVVRWGEDGVALSFVLPAKANVSLWATPVDGGSDRTELEEILRAFQLAKALAFVNRISPSATEEVRHVLRDEMSSYRAESAIQIAFEAEKMLESAPQTRKMEGSLRLVERILLGGSWAEDEAARHLWAGFLASSCLTEGNDEVNLLYLDLLNMLAAVHVHILNAACERVSEVVVADFETDLSKPSSCTIAEIQRATGVHDLLRVGRDIQYLIDLGLLENNFRSSLFVPLDDVRVTPTDLGLQLYARCNWHPKQEGELRNSTAYKNPAEVQ